jgi:tetratricopeptide (TPR) repeat protein
VSAAKSSSSGGGSHAHTASSAVTEDQVRLASRLFGLAALWSLLCGLLLVLSFVVVALVAFGAMLAVAVATGAVWLLRHYQIEERLSTLLVSAARGAGRLGSRVRGLGVRRRIYGLGMLARSSVADAPARAASALSTGLRWYAIAVYRSRIWASQLLASGRPPISSVRQARELNELGAQLRRRGAHEQAAEQHRVALEIVRDLGDEQAEALTLNSLALALAQSGAEAEAVGHLEQARVVLHELGDEEHEAQVIANLGLVYRRQGQSEEAAILFQEALERLPPESPAYRQIKEELRRAS